MKKYLLSLLSCLCIASLFAQNVGIGTPTPAEKLDVNGNVNIAGALKANGNAGSSGQFLMSTGNGLTWGSAAGFKKTRMFTANGTFTVPAGVTELMVEVWGGGSGGTAFCGGSSGGYANVVIPVTPGDAVDVSIGAGSPLGSTGSTAGGTTTVTFPSGTIFASGGGGILQNTAVAYSSGLLNAGGGSFANIFSVAGKRGQANHSTFGLKNASTYVETISYGAGGGPIGMINDEAMVGDVVRLENGVAVNKVLTRHTTTPSGGGAAGETSGWSGAGGLAIFRFN